MSPPGLDAAPSEPAAPPEVVALAARLRRAGHSAWLVGGCVRDRLRGVAVRDFDLATSATPEQTLALVARAIPTGLRHGTVTVPSRAGPIDVTTFRAGPSLEDDLAHRDFTVNAMALDPETNEIVDPFGGREDLERRRLRAVGSARERLAEDPLRALRAARMVATLGLAPDADLEAALPAAREGLARVARERVRAELDALLVGPFAHEALGLLARTGLAEEIVPGTRRDAGRIVAALPPDVDLRLAAWLIATRVASALASLRMPRRRARRIERLLRLHPVDAPADCAHPASLRRLLQKAGDEDALALVALRRAELEASPSSGGTIARERVDAIAAGLDRLRSAGALALHRLDLALDGAGVMEALGVGPGRHVGEALRYLTERVLEDPSRNTPEGLRALLVGWQPLAASRHTSRRTE